MKKKSLFLESFLILLGPAGGYVGYYQHIACKPSQAGFWLILALGLAIGVVLTRIILQTRKVNKN